MNNKTILTSTILTVVIIGMMIIPTNAFAQPNKNTKEINCDNCTLRFSGKNDVTVKFNAGGGGGTGSQGPKGDTGATGATGAQGPQGEQGVPGAEGPAGVNGTNGISGVSGTNGTMLDNQTINNLQYINDNIDTIKALVDAWNDGTLGVPEEVITNETTPAPIENVTTPAPVENQTTPLPINVTTPENVTGNVPINVTGNITVPGGNFSGDVNVTLPNGSIPIAPQDNQTGNLTSGADPDRGNPIGDVAPSTFEGPTFGGSVLQQIFG